MSLEFGKEYTMQKQAALDSRAEAIQGVRAAQRLVKQDRAGGLAALHDLFRAGTVPDPPLDGRYAGELVALAIAPGLTKLSELVVAIWMPWQGKTFAAARSCGDNIFQRNALPLAYALAPFYRGFIDDTPTTARAFAFRTYLAPGKKDIFGSASCLCRQAAQVASATRCPPPGRSSVGLRAYEARLYGLSKIVSCKTLHRTRYIQWI